MHPYYRVVFVLLLLACASSLEAQNFAGYNWYFGNSNQGVRFSRSDNAASLINNQAIPFGTGASAVASDQTNANLLFYTDGNRVVDVTHVPMPNGGGLLADAAQNQPVVITKIPGQKNQYYIFHRQGGTVRLTTVDMNQFGNAVFPAPALGDVTTKNSGVLALTGRSEAMIVIPHINKDDFWLITHASGSPDYTVTLVTSGGVFTNTVFSGLGLISQAANFSYHPQSGRIAVSPQEITRDVEIVNFDNATGILSFNQTVLNTGVPTIASGQAIYDTEWSSNGQYLYISRHGEPAIQADVLQYDILNPFVTLTSVLPQPNSIFRSYGLQMGPDSVLYHLYQAVSGGPFLMASITNTDTVATEVVYNPQAFGSNINFNATQFPSFAPYDTAMLSVTFTSLGTCSNTPTSFFPTVVPTADSLRWSFGDGGGTSDWSPVYTYTAGGSYPVTVTAFLNGDSAQFTQNVNITQFDLQITLVQDTTACSCELPFPKAPNPPPQCGQFTVTAQIGGGTPLSTQWFGPAGLMPTMTTATLTPDSAGYYYIVVTDATGCTAYAGVNIKEYGVQDQRANIWHFGQNAGIDFNPAFDNPPTVPVPINGPVNSPEGSATISDRNGQVIFSTDGQHVYDRTGTDITPLPNPPGLGGEPGATQSSIIIPVPGDETLYYIFTTQEVQGANTYELRYSLFDLKLNNGLGGILEHNILLFARSTERITSDGNWLIAHEYGNNSFRAYQITSLGISNPVISSIGSDHVYTSAENGQGYMELGGNNQLAVALSTPGVSNVVEVFDFDPATGIVSNFRTANLNNPNGQVYGLEFSGNKLLATLKNAVSSQIVEFFFDSLNVPYRVKQPPITVNNELGAIQRGPDGQIYVAVNGNQFLGTIQVNPDTTQVSTYTPNGFQLLGGTLSQLGLPNFIQIIVDPVQGPGISVAGVCEDDSVSFVGTPTDPIDVFFWQVRQGVTVLTTSDQSSFNYFFPDPGNYVVTLRLTNRCGLDTTLTQPFTIFPKPPTPTFLAPGDFPVICSSSLQLQALPADDPDLSYLWSTGETTRIIAVNQQANYSVTITSSRGCASSGSLIIADNRPIVNLPPNTTICQNAPVFPLDAQNPVLGTTYAWTLNGAPLGNSQTQSVSTSLAGLFEYEVTVTSPGGPGIGCVGKDSIIYTINPSPVFTATPFNTSACGANDGRIELNITGPPATLFSYFIVGPSPTVSGTDQALGVISTPSTLLPGVYGISVTDQVSGCPTTTTAPISDNAFTITNVVRQNTCDPVNLIVSHTAVGNFTYRVIDAITAQVVTTGGPISGSPFTITGVNAGSYLVEMTASGCTVATLPQTVVQDPLVVVNGFTSDACVNPITITVNGGTSWAWTGPNIVGSTTAQTISANPPQGPQTYTVRASQPGLCPIDVSETVNVNNDVVADFTQTDACADQVTLTATPAGPYTYRWFRAGVQIPGGQFITATLADNGIQYRVEVVNGLSGCVFPSVAKPVLVAGDLQLSLTTTNPCIGSPFTLSTAVNQPGATYVWRLNGNIITGQTASTLTETRGGTYEVTATVGACNETSTITILLAPVTPGKLFDTALICPEPANPDPNTREVVLDPGSDFISYNWFKDGVNLGYTDPTYTADEAGIYSVDLVNVFLCASADRTTVEVDCEPRIVAPTAFRPASSLDTNREFGVLTFFIDDTGFQVFIFNRWGEMVYQSSDRDFRWNGGYKNNGGQLLPAGTYTYVVRYKSSYRPEEGTKEKRGGVMLVR
ncbi:MAG: gliding motility-associated C-terminal domain-containing protein [Cyclobacteriaceae bacterium]|nr:gliding motility-associated C-terminal domain-containing protein [Cyclobacteriaceae bacterium]